MNWLIIPILLFIILVIFVLLNKPKQEVLKAVPYNPLPKAVIRKTVQVTPPPPVIDVPDPVDTSMYDCTLDKSLDPEFEKTFFTPAAKKVELDFPATDIGCCPSSKPMSTDLPIGNVPMCFAEKRKTYLRKNV